MHNIMKIQFLYFICLLTLISPLAVNAAEHIKSAVPNAQKVGEGRMTYLFWDVYDAQLFAPNGKWTAQSPYALKLSYLRRFSGDKIADRSVIEMRKQGIKDEVKLATWHSQMKNIFPDVNENTSLTGIRTKNEETVFYDENKEIGRIRDKEFTKAFFNIWLSPKTSEPELRRQLLGSL